MGKVKPFLKTMIKPRRKSKVIRIGSLCIGGNNPIAIQSMVKAKTSDTEATLKQIRDLEDAGCEIIRLAVKDLKDAQAIKKIKRGTKLPLVADIHFDWRLAIAAIENGIDKIRLNPGNIDDRKQIKEIVRQAKLSHIPIRIGINSGSLKRALPVRQAGKSQEPRAKVVAQAMINAALDYIKILEGLKFSDIVISLKAANIFDTTEAYQRMAELCDYPFHLGLTATGIPLSGAVKSSMALGILLSQGLGDTIRVSLTDKPTEEVRVAKYILEALNLRRFAPQIISCPTCGRCEINLVEMVKELEKKLSTISDELSAPFPKVAVMGCVVNGPGEAKEADLGIAFGKREGLLFRKGKPVRRVKPKDCINILLTEIKRF